jgi:hypothetical protein
VAYGVGTDANENIFLTGSYSGLVDFGAGAIGSNGNDAFLAKFSPAGVHLWSKHFNNSSVDRSRAITIDPSGNPIIAVSFQGAMNFGGANLMAASAMYDFAVAKLDGSSGAHVWSRVFGGNRDDEAYGLGSDAQGNVFVTGYFEETVDFGTGGISSGTADAIFLFKLTSAGTTSWAKRLGGPFANIVNGISVERAGSVVITGSFQSSGDFGGPLLKNAGVADIFAAKYSPSGEHLWSQSFGGVKSDQGMAITTDLNGKVFVAGKFQGTCTFGGPTLSSVGFSDAFFLSHEP